MAQRAGEALARLVCRRGLATRAVGTVPRGYAQGKTATVVAVAFAESRESSSVAAVLNENGVVVDHAVVAAGGFVPRERQKAMVEAVAKLAERNAADFVVLNTALGVQTAGIQRALAARLRHEVPAGIRSDAQTAREGAASRPAGMAAEVLVADDAVSRLRAHAASPSLYPPDLAGSLPAVFLARFAQNPLRETAALYWTAPTEPLHSALLELELDEDQAAAPPPMLLREFEKVLSVEVAAAGVSLHEAATYLDGFGRTAGRARA